MKQLLKISPLLLVVILPSLLWSAVLVWNNNTLTFTDPENLNTVDSAYAIINALANNFVWKIDEVDTLPGDLGGYDTVFVLLGSWPMNGALSISEQDTLVSYLENWGNIYVEGGDFGNDYYSTTLFSWTGATFEHDGRYVYDGGNVDVLEGTGGGPFEGYSFVYYAYQIELPDNYVDELSAEPDDVLFTSRKAGEISNVRCVFNDPETTEGKVYYSTIIFGSLQDGMGQNTKDALMAGIISLLDIEVSIQPTSLGYIKSLFR